MKAILFVGFGGFIGAVSRYLTSGIVTRFVQHGFPWGTLVVNFLGCILLGIFTGFILEKNVSWPLHEFFVIGVLGGFTTFSAFGLETFQMLKTGALETAAVYVVISLATGVTAIGIGLLLSRNLIN
ncbi:MAG: fluoride efflux transporter CrcB [Candidatus Marinimicrobia bacterium]|nr:fluoride efflux transporter CrcB [Candidatus Neomarinimicrobiota bacterium]